MSFYVSPHHPFPPSVLVLLWTPMDPEVRYDSILSQVWVCVSQFAHLLKMLLKSIFSHVRVTTLAKPPESILSFKTLENTWWIQGKNRVCWCIHIVPRYVKCQRVLRYKTVFFISVLMSLSEKKPANKTKGQQWNPPHCQIMLCSFQV